MRVPREEISDPVSATLLEHSQSLTKLDQRLRRQQEMEERSLADLQKSKTLLVSDFQHKRSALRIDLSILGVQSQSSSRMTKTCSAPPGHALWLQASADNSRMINNSGSNRSSTASLKMIPHNLPHVLESDSQCGEVKDRDYIMSAFPEETLDQFNFPEIMRGSSRADHAPGGKEFTPPGSPLPGSGRNSGKQQGTSPKSAHRALPGGRASLAFGPRVLGSPRPPNNTTIVKSPRLSSPPGSPSGPQKSAGSSARRSASHGDRVDRPSSPRSPLAKDNPIVSNKQALSQNSVPSVASDGESPRSFGDLTKTAACGRGFQTARPMVKSSHNAVGSTHCGRSSYSGSAPSARSTSASGTPLGSSLGSSLYRKNSGWLWKPQK